MKIQKVAYRFTLYILLSLSLTGSLHAAKKGNYWVTIFGGYMNGLGGGIELSLRDISRNLPLGFHLSGAWSHQNDPGNAVFARKVFINDATGGNDNIIEYGYSWIFGFDISYRIKNKKDFRFAPYIGVRYVAYKAFFDYQGGNEAFDVYSSPWGITLGARIELPLSRRLYVGLNGGGEYYIPAQIKAHGTFYNPSGVDDNPRAPYTYKDADTSVRQPSLTVKGVVTIGFRL